MNFLDGENAQKYREKVTQVIIKLLVGDKTSIQEIDANNKSPEEAQTIGDEVDLFDGVCIRHNIKKQRLMDDIRIQEMRIELEDKSSKTRMRDAESVKIAAEARMLNAQAHKLEEEILSSKKMAVPMPTAIPTSAAMPTSAAIPMPTTIPTSAAIPMPTTAIPTSAAIPAPTVDMVYGSPNFGRPFFRGDNNKPGIAPDATAQQMVASFLSSIINSNKYVGGSVRAGEKVGVDVSVRIIHGDFLHFIEFHKHPTTISKMIFTKWIGFVGGVGKYNKKCEQYYHLDYPSVTSYLKHAGMFDNDIIFK